MTDKFNPRVPPETCPICGFVFKSGGFCPDHRYLTDPPDPVAHPSHYNTGKIEVIEFIEDQALGFHLGNAVKYICRAGRKDSDKMVEDMEKAIW